MSGLKTAFLLTCLTLLLVAMGGALGGKSGLVIAFVFAAAMNLGTYWFSDSIVLRMYGAREVAEGESPAFHGLVRRLATAARLPMPRVYVIPSESPNAFATGRNPEHAAVAATEGLLRLLTPEELEGVMAHELAHVRNRDTLISTVVATIAGAISMLGNMLQWSALLGGGRGEDEEGGGVMGGLLMAFVAPIAAMLIQFAVSRSREFLADETGAAVSHRPLALASALAKLDAYSRAVPMSGARPATAHLFIVNPLSGGSFLRLFSTHPPIEARIARLESLARTRG
ncbi:MAG: zinc metalloprotease HtpX [Deltaproteobacteria bacterium]|nr:zinc metalloprotease HtpX [Deltaproteobacteria bacterium]